MDPNNPVAKRRALIRELRGEGQTLQQVAERLGISRERVRQLERVEGVAGDYGSTGTRLFFSTGMKRSPENWRLYVKDTRRRLGFLLQEDLAKQMRVSLAAVRKWESKGGRVIPRRENIARLEELLVSRLRELCLGLLSEGELFTRLQADQSKRPWLSEWVIGMPEHLTDILVGDLLPSENPCIRSRKKAEEICATLGLENDLGACVENRLLTWLSCLRKSVIDNPGVVEGMTIPTEGDFVGYDAAFHADGYYPHNLHEHARGVDGISWFTAGDLFLPQPHFLARWRECIEHSPLYVTKASGERVRFDRGRIMQDMLRACEKLPILDKGLGGLVSVPMKSIEDSVTWASYRVAARCQEEYDREVKSSVIGSLVMEEVRGLNDYFVSFARTLLSASTKGEKETPPGFWTALDRFLTEAGSPVDEAPDESIAPATPDLEYDKPRFCAQCGYEIPAAGGKRPARFCSWCGESLSLSSPGRQGARWRRREDSNPR